MTRGLRALVWKDLKRQFSDRKGVVVYLLVPLLLTFIMGLSFGGGIFGDTGISAIPLAISGGDLPSGLRDQPAQGLQESGFFQVTWTDSTAAADLVRTGDAKAALILSDRFLNRMLTGEKTTLKLWKDPDSAIKAGINRLTSAMVDPTASTKARFSAVFPSPAVSRPCAQSYEESSVCEMTVCVPQYNPAEITTVIAITITKVRAVETPTRNSQPNAVPGKTVTAHIPSNMIFQPNTNPDNISEPIRPGMSRK